MVPFPEKEIGPPANRVFPGSGEGAPPAAAPPEPAAVDGRGGCAVSPPESRPDGGEGRAPWAVLEPGVYRVVARTAPRLPPGLYAATESDDQVVLEEKAVQADGAILCPGTRAAAVLREIETFWESRDRYVAYGFLHRRGYLLHGPTGSGKTMIIQIVVQRAIERGGIAMLCSEPAAAVQGLAMLRQAEPEREVVCFFEDLESLIEEHGDAEILGLLDGQNRIDRVLNIATTNHPEKLEPRIIGRPRRFDRILGIGPPEPSVRRAFLEKKLKDAPENDLDRWVAATEGFSFAALTDLVISIRCLGCDFQETARLLRDRMQAGPRAYQEPATVGFAPQRGH